ncbi:hypothetical protein [Burkholderia ubonensis]|uniref:hypothetical protein n=1 Tax=Burkholderia ubonensis TaxID=101571 RepID=UPI00075AE39D|nr:hypothetical protein [Burkholderia ubonensis]KVP39679.1 hypothetical protein WJ87_05710 [Burkholderia ubonensis]
MAKAAAYEQDLISMVSSLIHLRTIGEELGKKDFVIPRMQAAMQGAIQAFSVLNDTFDRTEEALQQDAQPYLQAWLDGLSFSVGAELRFEGCWGSSVARVRGRLAGVRLHKKLLDSKRCILLILEEPGFSSSATGAFAPHGSFTKDQLSPVLNGQRRASLETVKEGGVARQVVHVLLPIKKADIASWASGSYYFRVV